MIFVVLTRIGTFVGHCLGSWRRDAAAVPVVTRGGRVQVHAAHEHALTLSELLWCGWPRQTLGSGTLSWDSVPEPTGSGTLSWDSVPEPAVSGG